MHKITSPLFVFSLLLFYFPANLSASPNTLTVTKVIDGDTLQLSNGEKVRLVGVDTPESKYNPKLKRDASRSHQDAAEIIKMGKQAAEFTRSLADGKEVRLEFDVTERDKYGRLLAFVFIRACSDCKDKAETNHEYKLLDDGLYDFLNATIVKSGYAQAMTIPPNVKYKDLFVRLEAEARENHRGLWSSKPDIVENELETGCPSHFIDPNERSGGLLGKSDREPLSLESFDSDNALLYFYSGRNSSRYREIGEIDTKLVRDNECSGHFDLSLEVSTRNLQQNNKSGRFTINLGRIDASNYNEINFYTKFGNIRKLKLILSDNKSVTAYNLFYSGEANNWQHVIIPFNNFNPTINWSKLSSITFDFSDSAPGTILLDDISLSEHFSMGVFLKRLSRLKETLAKGERK